MKRKPPYIQNLVVYNRFFETVDVYVDNAGIQFKTNHSFEYTNTRNILQYVIDGEGTLECKNKVYPLSPYSLFLLPKDVHVKYYAKKDNPYRYYWIAFSGAYAEVLLTQSGLTPSSPVRTVVSPVVKRAFKRIYESLRTLQDSGEIDCSLQPKIQASFYEIFGVLLQDKKTRQGENVTDLVSRATAMMNSEYSEGITVTDLCEKLYVNRTHFSALFKKSMGVTPAKYLTDLRFGEACKLLKQTALPVSDIAEAVGLAPNVFFKLFKARMETTPNQYRRG